VTPPKTPAVYIAKAERAFSAARVLVRAEDAEGACNRGYYAMHDAAHAALIAAGRETPDAMIKTHHTLIAEFGKKLVQGGQMDARLGRAFNKVEDIRRQADYSSESPPLDEARWVVGQAEAFVAAIKEKFSL
jgi:uncharacterized protein (UPF0332 family)